MARRGRGEGGISQRHDHLTCPPAVDGVRPEHRCRGRWQATVDLGVVNGKRQRKTIYAATRKQAATKLQAALAAKQANALVVRSTTMEAWLTYWLEVICVERGLMENTMKSHRSKVKNYLIPHLGRQRVDRVEPEHIRTMYAAMRKQGLGDGTLSQTHAILRRALEVAVREGKASRNAAALMDRPSAPDNPPEPLSMAEAQLVLEAAGDDPRPYLALYLGLRQSEALGLMWPDVDFERGVLHVERKLAAKDGGGGFVFEVPKTRLSKAPLPLPTVVLSRLKVRYAQHLADGGDPDGLIFHRNGEPLPPWIDNKRWRELLKAAGVEHRELRAARNTTADLLRALGVNAQDQRAIMRHATLGMTEHYQSDDLDRKREAMGALEAGLGRQL